MKFIITALLLLTATAHGKDCPDLVKITHEMNQLSSNIANVNTTRTPEGGPYKPFINGKQVSTVMYKYEPDHPDANEHGYVQYPNINLNEEMENLVQASRKWETAKVICMNGKQNKSVKREPGHSWQSVLNKH